jgi:dTDP-4-amino-4,6-dideoxygalactose transaminase
MITKKPEERWNYLRNHFYTENARTAWRQIIRFYNTSIVDPVFFLPAYIGWSPNEGSGVFDAIAEENANYLFYSMNLSLSINFEDLKGKILGKKNCIVLLIHYFGFPDINYNEIVFWLKSNNVIIVEDCAHAWLTDIIGGICGRAGQFSFYSLHKLLPVTSGGILVNNYASNDFTNPVIYQNTTSPFIYDLYNIFNIRRNNFRFLLNQLQDKKNITIIHPKLFNGIAPQSFAVLVKNKDRIYHEMNRAGYGVVSLYHTMIVQLNDEEQFPEANFISRHILNFPIHQDIDDNKLLSMVQHFSKLMDYD